ncbi:MAG: DNA recombination protein RmuC [Christensenellales bacterium]|jgi:DNA recombination protein RmuC
MDGLIIALLSTLIILSAVILVVLIRRKDNSDAFIDTVQGYTDRIKEHIDLIASTRERGITQFVGLKLEDLSERVKELAEAERKNATELMKYIVEQLKYINESVTKAIGELKKDNNEQLKDMRTLVDKTLVEMLDRKLKQSYDSINQSLQAVNEGFGRIQELSSGVTDLNKVFTRTKTRGVWGEIMLNSLLEQMLTKDQYRVQEPIKGREAVDFAIVLPGKSDENVLLPIDAKFPDTSYQKLLEARDGAEYEKLSKALRADIKKEAKSISNKYISPPKTTDFAIMYLPTEGLFAEAAKSDGLLMELQNNYRVIIAGPTTLSSLLTSLNMGFKTLAIEKRSIEIRELLLKFRMDFNKFTLLLDDTHDKLNKITDTIDKAARSTRKISKDLSRVESISDIQAELPEGENES